MSRSDPDYMKEYREKNPNYRKRNNDLTKARDKAKQILVERHRSEYNRIYIEVRKEMGI